MSNIGSTYPNFHLDAIAWKCHETGLTYGQLTSQCSSADLYKIYEEYQEVLIARKKKSERVGEIKKSSRAARKENDASEN